MILSLLLFLALTPLGAQESSREILIKVNSPNAKELEKNEFARTYLNGYRRTINGQTIIYHSSHPDADVALLVRANREYHSASWETDSLTDPSRDGNYHFVWLAGFDRAGWGENTIEHRFDLLINGKHAFTFRNFKGPTADHWRVPGDLGGELAFNSRMADKFGDLFGYMFLTIPARECHRGAPLTLQVVGADDDNLEWYMAFQYRFNFTPRLRPEPAILRGKDRTNKELRLSLDNLIDGRTIEIDAPGEEHIRKPLNVGANIFMIPIPVTGDVKDYSIGFTLDKGPTEHSQLSVPPFHTRTLYLLSYSHNDIGYTDLQPAVERKQWDNIEMALRLIDRTRDYPPDAQYKWNLEGLFPVEGYLRQASAKRREEFLQAVRTGSIGLNALYANMLTGLANSVEMSHFTGYARYLSKEFSIPIITAVESDVPGFTWGIVSAFAQSGVKYFASAPNSGDRIGYIIEQWGDKPFWWTSQSGEEKVLMWVAGASYSSFHEGRLTNLGDEKILKLCRKLEESNYPYEYVHLPYTLGDNGTPDSLLSDFVKDWNARYATPRLIIATHAQMFKDFDARYGVGLPSIQGDLTPYWEDGAVSTAYETALNRHAVDRLIQGEALWSMAAPSSYPAALYDSAWRKVALWDEHTWGAANSITDPDSPAVKGQWEIKQKFALDADSLARTLAQQALKSMTSDPPSKSPSTAAHRGPAGGNGVVVYNTSSWMRTDVVVVPRSESTTGDRVLDGNKSPVPSQRLSTGELAILIRSIPPLSARRFVVEKGKPETSGRLEISSNSIANDNLSFKVDERTGSISAFEWMDRQLVDHSKGAGLNEYLYMPGKNPDSLLRVSNVAVTVKEKGPLVGSILVTANAPGCDRYSAEIRLIAGIPRLDIINNLDKRAVRSTESVHIAFPFYVPEPQVSYDVANAFVRAEKDQLIGACRTYLSVTGCADVSNDGYGVTLLTRDAPLIEVGNIVVEQPWIKSLAPSSRLYSYAMNNYWHTNYKADQSGPVELRYRIIPHEEFYQEDALRAELELRQPLLVFPASAKQEPRQSLLTIDPPDVVALSVKPTPDGRALLLYLYNPSNRTQDAVRVTANVGAEWPTRRVATSRTDNSSSTSVFFNWSDPSGDDLGHKSDQIRMDPGGSIYVRVERRYGNK